MFWSVTRYVQPAADSIRCVFSFFRNLLDSLDVQSVSQSVSQSVRHVSLISKVHWFDDSFINTFVIYWFTQSLHQWLLQWISHRAVIPSLASSFLPLFSHPLLCVAADSWGCSWSTCAWAAVSTTCTWCPCGCSTSAPCSTPPSTSSSITSWGHASGPRCGDFWEGRRRKRRPAKWPWPAELTDRRTGWHTDRRHGLVCVNLFKVFERKQTC